MLGVIMLLITWATSNYQAQVNRFPGAVNDARLSAGMALYWYDQDSIIKVLNKRLKFNDHAVLQDWPEGLKVSISQNGQGINTPVRVDSMGNIRITFKWDTLADKKYKRTLGVFNYVLKDVSDCDAPLLKNDSIELANAFAKGMADRQYAVKFSIKYFCTDNIMSLPQSSKDTIITGQQLAYRTPFFLGEQGRFRKYALIYITEKPGWIVLNDMWPSFLAVLLAIVLIIIVLIALWRFVNKQKRLEANKKDLAVNLTREIRAPIAMVSDNIVRMQAISSADKEVTAGLLASARQELNHLNNLVTMALNKASDENSISKNSSSPAIRPYLTWLFILAVLLLIGFEWNWADKQYGRKRQQIMAQSGEAYGTAEAALRKAHQDSALNILKNRLAFNDSISYSGFDDIGQLLIKVVDQGQNILSSETQTSVDHFAGIRLLYQKRKGAVSPNYIRTRKVLHDWLMSDTCHGATPCSLPVTNKDSAMLVSFFRRALIEQHLYNEIELEKLSFNKNPHKHEGVIANSSRELREATLSREAILSVNADSWALGQMWPSILLSIFADIAIIAGFFYLVRLIREQQRLAEAKDNFINNMTHELKTPIAIVLAAVEGMQDFNALQDKEKTKRYLDTSRQELARLEKLVDRLLYMDVNLSVETVDIQALIQDVVASFQHHARKAVVFAIHNQTAVSHIPADALHLRNVLVNLIDNAINYSGGQVNISITCSSDDWQYRIAVADDGLGIAADQLDAIFGKFYRIATGNVHDIKGSGLGLHYVQHIVNLHGGSVAVTSTINKGSEFVITLPLSS